MSIVLARLVWSVENVWRDGAIFYTTIIDINMNLYFPNFLARSSPKSTLGSRVPVFSGTLPETGIAFSPPVADPSLGYSTENRARSRAAACIGSERYLTEHKRKGSFSRPQVAGCVILFPTDNLAS